MLYHPPCRGQLAATAKARSEALPSSCGHPGRVRGPSRRAQALGTDGSHCMLPLFRRKNKAAWPVGPFLSRVYFRVVFLCLKPASCGRHSAEGLARGLGIFPRAPGRGWKAAAESSPSPAPGLVSSAWSLLAAPGRSGLRRGAGQNQVRPECAVRACCKPPVPGAGPGQCGDRASGARAISAPGIHAGGGGPGLGHPGVGSAQLLCLQASFSLTPTSKMKPRLGGRRGNSRSQR